MSTTQHHLMRLAAGAAAAGRQSVFASSSRRAFHASRAMREGGVGASIPPVRRPVGAFRGGILGFLAGSSTAGAALYYYVIDEYKVSNQLLTEDIYSLQGAVQRIETYVRSLEERAGVNKK